MTRWYRAYSGTVSDPKVAEVALIAECSRSVAISAWHAILESAADAQDGGHFETSSRRIAATLCEPIATVDRVLAALAEVGLIRDGVVVAWQRRQYESDTSTERSRKHRERKRNTCATLHDRCATPPETETETDTSSLRSEGASAGDDDAAPADPHPKPKAPRASRLSADWSPSPADRGYAVEHGVPPDRIDRVAEDFRGYWLAKAGASATKVDWSLTWQGWCRREADRLPRGSPAARAPPPAKGTNAMLDSLAKFATRNDHDDRPPPDHIDLPAISRGH